METTAFEIIAPEKVVFSGSAEMVVAPGVDGDFGVLPGHAPLIAGLRPGVVTIYEGDVSTQRIFVGGGVAEAMPGGCIILAEQAVLVENINVEAVQKQINDLRNTIDDAGEDATRGVAEAALIVAQAQLAAVTAD